MKIFAVVVSQLIPFRNGTAPVIHACKNPVAQVDQAGQRRSTAGHRTHDEVSNSSILQYGQDHLCCGVCQSIPVNHAIPSQISDEGNDISQGEGLFE